MVTLQFHESIDVAELCARGAIFFNMAQLIDLLQKTLYVVKAVLTLISELKFILGKLVGFKTFQDIGLR